MFVLNKRLIVICLFVSFFGCANNAVYAENPSDWGGTGNSGNGGGEE